MMMNGDEVSGGDNNRSYLHEFFDDIKHRYNDNDSCCNYRPSLVWPCSRIDIICRIVTVFSLKDNNQQR